MRHIKALLLFFTGVLLLSGCLKKAESNIDPYDFSAPVYTLEWIPPGGGGTTTNAGLQYFSAGALLYPATDVADTANFTVRLTGGNSDKDITVTIGPDAKALLDNYKTDSINYQAMPDSLYKFVNTTATIKKGTAVAYFQVIFYPSKIDPTQNYLLAPTVISGDHEVSSNQGHIYFHTIGNIFAGTYTVTGTRYNYTGAIAWNNVLPVPAGYTATTNLGAGSLGSRSAAPDNGSTFEILFANLGAGYNYIFTYDPVAQTLSVDYSFDNVYSNIVTTVVSLTPPTATTKASFRIITHYNNALAGAGNDRIVDETFTQN